MDGIQRRVLEAVKAGAETALEVEAFLEGAVTLKQCTGHLANLVLAGKLEVTGRVRYDGSGRPSNRYRPV